MLMYGGRVEEEPTWNLGTQSGLRYIQAVGWETVTLASLKHLNSQSLFPHL